MRKSAIASILLHVVIASAALLWLIWGFIPLANLVKSVTTLLIVALAVWLIWIRVASRRTVVMDGSSVRDSLALMETHDPVVLVCGDQTEALFQGQRLRKTAQGWWLRIDDVDHIINTVREIQQYQPHQTGQLSVMYVCQADLQTDELVLRAFLRSIREQIGRLTKETGFSLPVFLSCEFAGAPTPWIIIRGDRPMVYVDPATPVALTEWLQTAENHARFPVITQAFTFIREVLLDELEKSQRSFAPVKTFAVVLRIGTVQPGFQSLWAQWLYRRTSLRLAEQAGDMDLATRFPDAILPLLSAVTTRWRRGQNSRHLVFLLWGCALAAMGCSVVNNQKLIGDISADLQRWYLIPTSHYAAKAQSLAVLKQDALLLERWQRQGEPYRYGLGYYPGQHLWLAVQQAIDTYEPPQTPAPKSVPRVIRLDSMSLFDSGKAVLKPGSTKKLVASLIDIKAKPGWLIVISGHTDSTGSQQLNQALSLQRAMAVRQWMEETGDVPEGCITVQGFGDTRPVASNDTPAGRAQNRRVEISLVPQADACRMPIITTLLSPSDDNFTY